MIKKCVSVFEKFFVCRYFDTTPITRKYLVLIYVLSKYERWIESKIKARGKSMLEHKLPQSAGVVRQTDARTSARGGIASEKANKRFSKDVLFKTRKLCPK